MFRRTALALTFMAAPIAALCEENGAALYAMHCVACHGAEAQGDGALTAQLGVPVPDLTGLSTRNNGVFPSGLVVDTIEGHRAPEGQISPMPTFDRLRDGASVVFLAHDGREIRTRAPVLAIAQYLEAMQRP